MSEPLRKKFGTALVVNDLQFPYHDPALWEVTTQIGIDAGVDTVIWDGDILDFENLSSFAHNPYKIRTADEDVRAFHPEVREPLIKAIKPKREIWNNGNHEYRYTRYSEHNASALGMRVEPRDFLMLPKKVQFTEYGKGIGFMLTPKLLISHGWNASKWSAYSAKATALDLGDLSVVCGHTHRIGAFYHTTPRGVQASYEVGHMCDWKRVPSGTVGVGGFPDWQQVAGTLIRYEKGGDSFHVEVLPVFGSKQDKVIANGNLYRIDR